MAATSVSPTGIQESTATNNGYSPGLDLRTQAEMLRSLKKVSMEVAISSRRSAALSHSDCPEVDTGNAGLASRVGVWAGGPWGASADSLAVMALLLSRWC